MKSKGDKMAKKIEIIDVNINEGSLYQLQSEDGPIVVYDLVVSAMDKDYNIYHHYYFFKGSFVDEEGFHRANMGARYGAEKLVERIKEVMVIDLEHWEKVGKLESREECLGRLEREWSDNSDHFRD